MATKRVRILAPYQAPDVDISKGDVVEVDSARAADLVAAGTAEYVSAGERGSKAGGAHPQPDPLPVGSGPYDPPAGAKEQLDVGAGGNSPDYEPLPVGSGPYDPPAGALEQLDVGAGGNTPPFEPLPVAPESETITPTDEKGQPDYDISEATEDVEPALTYEDWTVADLRERARDRGLKATGKKADLIAVLEEADRA